MTEASQRIRDLPEDALTDLLAAGRLGLTTGPLTFRISTREEVIARNIGLLYRDHEIHDAPQFSDFHVSVGRPRSIRRWVVPQVEFRLDGYAPFYSLPAEQAFAMLEWGMNWCIATSCHQYLMLHAAVLAKEDRAVVMPAAPGSGKSTLSAALAMSGWRLLSDELALIDTSEMLVFGLARPINLKNDSIDIVRSGFGGVRINDPVQDTKKGTVAHMAAPSDAVALQHTPARVKWLILPQFKPGIDYFADPLPHQTAMAAIVRNSFNYEVLGERGFQVAAQIAEAAGCHQLCYGSLDAALQWIDRHLA